MKTCRLNARDVLDRLLHVFDVAPSVGLSQPWQVTVVTDPALKAGIYTSFLKIRQQEQAHYEGEHRQLYDTLKLEGVREAPVGLVVSLVTPAGHTLGTAGLPRSLEQSVVSAITLLWLAATAEGLGMGWLSLINPTELHALLNLAPDVTPLAYLCLGLTALDLPEPLLQTVGWAQRQPLRIDWRETCNSTSGAAQALLDRMEAFPHADHSICQDRMIAANPKATSD